MAERGAQTGVGVPALVARQRLLDALAGGRVAVVEAGGGFGKSVLAEQYREWLGTGAVALRLAPRDSDPALLCTTLIRSLRASRLSDLSAAVEDRDVLDEAIDALLAALAEAPAPVLFVVDDAHLCWGAVRRRSSRASCWSFRRLIGWRCWRGRWQAVKTRVAG